jgi:2-oxoglutarate ferredoxin oxidoreductase subunit alpha
MSETTARRPFLMTGNEACADGALAAGCRFFAGYPITPSSEIAEILCAKLPAAGGRFIQMEDEIASMAAVIGGSLAGVKSMTATSGPGFSLKQENLGYAVMAEVPCVVVNVMRGGPSTGLPTMPSQGDVMQARWGTHGDHSAIALAPYTVRETFDLTVRAFNLAERYRTPVILLMDEILGHVNEKVFLPEDIEIVDRKLPTGPPGDYRPYENTEDGVPPLAPFGTGYRYHVTGLYHDETGFPTANSEKINAKLHRIHAKIDDHRDDIVEVETLMLDDAEVGVFAYGGAARSARQAVRLAREKGIRAGLLRPKTVWPFPDREVRAMGESVKTVIVPEMNLGQMAHEVEWAVRGRVEVHRVNRVDGEPLTPAEVLARIEEVV